MKMKSSSDHNQFSSATLSRVWKPPITMAPTNKDSAATRMAGAPMFKAVHHPELDTLDLVAICDFLKKRARYLRLVAQNKKADGVNVTPITVVASIDSELLANLIDMEEIDANRWMIAPMRA
jgi:hypothetical protein